MGTQNTASKISKEKNAEGNSTSERLNVLLNKKPAYDIVYKEDFGSLKEELIPFEPEKKKFCIVTDSNVGALYAKQVKEAIEDCCAKVDVFTFDAGEQNKNLDTVKEIYRFLIEQHYDRKDMLIALGGGVVGDTCGYAAATYLRGISFIQVPTTLLAMVDSSIGGKTGVDFEQYKNMIGAFHMPKLVYMNLSVLKDLDERQYFSGFAEVMKSALIRDGIYYEWLIENLYEICDRELSVVKEMIYRCNLIKKNVVEKDPTEQGERALLNLGHTLGHAIEKYKNFSMLHGECVALGCVAAAYISWKKELLSMEEYYEIRDMFVPFNLPISIDDIEPEKIVELTKSDKKMESGHIKFILLKKIGKAFISTDVTDEEMLAAVKEIYFSEEDERA
ncbi:MAG: 3-dehydroquinate synthase [Lachnospiraceae bacterium]